MSHRLLMSFGIEVVKEMTMPAKILGISTLGAIGAGLVCGLLGSGVFDAITGSGSPNPGGAIGAVGGALAGGHLTARFLKRREKGNEAKDG